MRDNGEVKQEILDFIEKHADKDQLPTFNKIQWVELNKKFEKDDIRRSLIKHIVDNKVPFPFREISKTDVDEMMLKLCKEPVVVDHVDGSVSKFEYEREFNGLIFDGKPKYNKISDRFQRENRYWCDTKHNVNILTSWTTGRALFTVINGFWTLKYEEMTRSTWNGILTVSVQVASQFRPAIVKNVLNHFKAKTYLDISSGWGDRLAGFYASSAKKYIGFDPSSKTFPVYQDQCESYERILGGKKEVIRQTGVFEHKGQKEVLIINEPAEDVDYSKLPNVDMIFSSPPYFMAERYEDSDKQSWVRYKTIDDWQNKFFHVVLEKCWSILNDRGYMIINISDIFHGAGERVHICDKMCEFVEKLEGAHFIGYAGMKLSLRPNMVIDKETKNLPFVEPMWIFRKGCGKDEEVNIDDLFE